MAPRFAPRFVAPKSWVPKKRPGCQKYLVTDSHKGTVISPQLGVEPSLVKSGRRHAGTADRCRQLHRSRLAPGAARSCCGESFGPNVVGRWAASIEHAFCQPHELRNNSGNLFCSKYWIISRLTNLSIIIRFVRLSSLTDTIRVYRYPDFLAVIV